MTARVNTTLVVAVVVVLFAVVAASGDAVSRVYLCLA
jgi:hypothetical protein